MISLVFLSHADDEGCLLTTSVAYHSVARLSLPLPRTLHFSLSATSLFELDLVFDFNRALSLIDFDM